MGRTAQQRLARGRVAALSHQVAALLAAGWSVQGVRAALADAPRCGGGCGPGRSGTTVAGSPEPGEARPAAGGPTPGRPRRVLRAGPTRGRATWARPGRTMTGSPSQTPA